MMVKQAADNGTGKPKAKRKRTISIAKLERIMLEGKVTLGCGCVVEPDGHCSHGNESPLLTLGLI